MKYLIAIPCMDQVYTTFMRALLQLERAQGSVQYAISCSSLIYTARNKLIEQAVAGDYDRVLWFDSDMDFPADTMLRLAADMDEGKDFVSGLYFKRRAPVEPVIYSGVGYYHDTMSDGSEQVTPVALTMHDYPRDSMFEIEGAGFGCVMHSVDLAKRIMAKHGAPFSPILGFGEDLSFCKRAKDIGATLWCDSRIKLGHIGCGTITEETYINGGYHGNITGNREGEAGKKD